MRAREYKSKEWLEDTSEHNKTTKSLFSLMKVLIDNKIIKFENGEYLFAQES